MGNNCKNKKNIWHKCRKYVAQILRLAGDVIHLSNLNGWTIPYYKSLPGSHLTIPKITHISLFFANPYFYQIFFIFLDKYLVHLFILFVREEFRAIPNISLTTSHFLVATSPQQRLPIFLPNISIFANPYFYQIFLISLDRYFFHISLLFVNNGFHALANIPPTTSHFLVLPTKASSKSRPQMRYQVISRPQKKLQHNFFKEESWIWAVFR